MQIFSQDNSPSNFKDNFQNNSQSDFQAEQYLLVLDKGEELMSSLNDFIAKHPEISSLWLNGIGAASSAVISFFDPQTKEYVDKTVSEDLEILALQGNLSFVGDEPRWHIHGVFSGRDYRAFGGHLQSMVVGLTCELWLQTLPFSLTKKHNPEIGIFSLKNTEEK